VDDKPNFIKKKEEKGRRKMYQKQGPSKGATTTLVISKYVK